jgi:hypothetical protein
MPDPVTTRHAEARMRQRGLRDSDLGLLLDAATRVAPDALLMTDADVTREIARRKGEIQRLERLRGCKAVVEGDVVITVYHTHLRERRQTLRKGRMSR